MAFALATRIGRAVGSGQTSITSRTCSYAGRAAFTIGRGRVLARRSVVEMSGKAAANGDAVSVHYIGSLDDGTVFDASRERGAPLSFTVGGGQVVVGFDKAVRGLKVGETRKVRVEPAEAYGDRNEELVMEVPKDKAPPGIKAGAMVQMMNGMPARVVSVTSDLVTIDLNHRLAGRPLNFEVELLGFEESKVLGPPPAGQEVATFAAGCFWGVELAFQRVVGVGSTFVGYTQGQIANPTYRAVCSGETGHTEAVAVYYDPAVVSYEDLTALFWKRLGDSALTLNKAGNDVGTQYRSGIYFHNDEQERIARSTLEQRSKELGQPVVTECLPAKDFYIAEDYHQQYLEKLGQSAEKGSTETIRCYG